MRPAPYRLTFALPPQLVHAVPVGRHQPCLAGCVLTVEACSLVTVEGPSRERVFDQVQRFIRVALKAARLKPLPLLPLQTPVTLRTPAHSAAGGPQGGFDGWSIVAGAEIAIVPTTIPAELFGQETAA